MFFLPIPRALCYNAAAWSGLYPRGVACSHGARGRNARRIIISYLTYGH